MPDDAYEVDSQTAGDMAGLILWHAIIDEGLVTGDADEEVDIGRCLDMRARCQEAGVDPAPGVAVSFVAGLIKEQVEPDSEWDECIFTALVLIAGVAEKRI